MAKRMTVDEAKEKIDKRVGDAVAKWWESVWPNIDKRVEDILESQVNTIVCQLLGFDNRWGEKWEIKDNGRGDSVAAQYLKGEGREAAMHWLEEKFKHTKGRVPPGIHGEATKLYDRVFEETIKQCIKQYAEKDAKERFTECIEQILKEHGIGADNLEDS